MAEREIPYKVGDLVFVNFRGEGTVVRIDHDRIVIRFLKGANSSRSIADKSIKLIQG